MPEVDTELDIERRAPPNNVALEARAVAAQQVAGRVKIEPDDSGGWRVVADGKRSPSAQGPPVDVPGREWDDDGSKPIQGQDFQDFVEQVKERAGSRKQYTANEQRSDAPGFWRITLNYDDNRFQE